jgi:2-oxoglutarate ferredoxin oxidoreductase subunit gamma
MIMSQEAFSKFVPDLKDGGLLLLEEDLVQPSKLKPGTRVFRCPGTRIAEELGKRMVLNIVMVGFFAAVAGVAGAEALRKAVGDSVPEAFRDLNLKAFDRGYEYGKKKLAENPNGEDLATVQAAVAVQSA